jgi:hypothetical protein
MRGLPTPPRRAVLRAAAARALCAVTIAAGFCGIAVTSADASSPAITSLRIAPRFLPAAGGTFTITARVRGAISCTVSAYGLGSPRTLPCRSGRISYRRHAPANNHATPERWTVQLEAHNGRRNAFAQSTVEVGASAPAAPAIVGLDACTAGPDCDYGAAYERFENWGNVAPEDFGDCTFAAAANWLQILFRWHVYPTILGYEFAQAGGTANGGLAQSALWHYWEHDGIASSYLTGLHSYATTAENVRNGVRDYAAMIVELRFGEGWAFAQYKAQSGTHDVVVLGFTPAGPLVATWGEVVQMTWEQWDDEAIGMWGIGATNPNGT